MSKKFTCARFFVALGACGVLFFSRLAGAQILQYTFDESGSGSAPALDTGTPPPADGTFVGAATRVSGGVGNSVAALDLSGNGGLGNYVDAGNVAKLDSLTGFTICMWVNLRGPTTNTAILVSQGTFLQNGWDLEIGGPDPSQTSISIQNLGAGQGQSSTSSFNADHQWAMVAGEFNGVTDTMTVYAGSTTSPIQLIGGPDATSPLIPSTSDFEVGGETSAAGANFVLPAWIDDVQIFNQALTVAQLQAVQQQDLPEPAGAALIPALGAIALCVRQRNCA